MCCRNWSLVSAVFMSNYSNTKYFSPLHRHHSRPQRPLAPFGQHQESRPLARSNDIPGLNGFVNTIDWDQNQSDLSDLILSMHRMTGSLWIADLRYWTWPKVAILGADQREHGLWGRECTDILMAYHANFHPNVAQGGRIRDEPYHKNIIMQ